MKTKRAYDEIGMDEICLDCGKSFGSHSGFCCLKPDGLGHIRDELFHSLIDHQDDRIKVTGDSIKIGPRKPAPAIPPEIHSSQPFDPVAAWEAVKALSKGS